MSLEDNFVEAALQTLSNTFMVIVMPFMRVLRHTY